MRWGLWFILALAIEAVPITQLDPSPQNQESISLPSISSSANDGMKPVVLDLVETPTSPNTQPSTSVPSSSTPVASEIPLLSGPTDVKDITATNDLPSETTVKCDENVQTKDVENVKAPVIASEAIGTEQTSTPVQAKSQTQETPSTTTDVSVTLASACVDGKCEKKIAETANGSTQTSSTVSTSQTSKQVSDSSSTTQAAGAAASAVSPAEVQDTIPVTFATTTSSSSLEGKFSDLGVSVLILNWERPQILKEKILPNLNKMAIVHEVIVSHGKTETMFDTPHLQKVRHFDHHDLNEKVGLLRRFYIAREAESSCVMHMDDDIHLAEEVIHTLYLNWREAPNVVHGYNGRALGFGDNHKVEYIMKGVSPGEIAIILTQVAMTSKAVNEFALEKSGKFESLQSELNATPRWNGEDILLSLSSILYNEQIKAPANKIYPRCYASNKSMFDDPYGQDVALSLKWDDHREFRTLFARAVVDEFTKQGADFTPIIRQSAKEQ